MNSGTKNRCATLNQATPKTGAPPKQTRRHQKLVPMGRIELPTSPLPRECSATELHGPWTYTDKPTKTGAGEGNRTLVLSLEGFSSTIELHPHGVGRGCKAAQAPTTTLLPLRPAPTAKIWWWGKDSNLRRQSRQIYSLIPLTAREPHPNEARDYKRFRKTLSNIPAR